jgi:DNA-binding CsgD family transcriptional regulator
VLRRCCERIAHASPKLQCRLLIDVCPADKFACCSIFFGVPLLSLDTPPVTHSSSTIRGTRSPYALLPSIRREVDDRWHAESSIERPTDEDISQRRQGAIDFAALLLGIAASYTPEVFRCLSEAITSTLELPIEPAVQPDRTVSPISAEPTQRRATNRATIAPEKNTRRPFGLTPSEVRVAELVSQGLSLREVATQLFVSTKTADFHLQSVYRKLDVHTRGEFAMAFFHLKAAA